MELPAMVLFFNAFLSWGLLLFQISLVFYRIQRWFIHSFFVNCYLGVFMMNSTSCKQSFTKKMIMRVNSRWPLLIRDIDS